MSDALFDPTEKRCGSCRQTQPLDKFSKRTPKDGRFRDGRHYWCQSCVRANANRYYAANSYGPRDYHFRTKYGISIVERDELIERQQGKCAICGDDQGDARWDTLSVDHDHETNRVRGMLCSHCNRGLGHFRDNPDLLLVAAAYLLQTQNVLSEGGAPLS